MRLTMAFLILVASQALAGGGTGVVGYVDGKEFRFQYFGKFGGLDAWSTNANNFNDLSALRNQSIIIHRENNFLPGTITSEEYSEALVVKTEDSEEIAILSDGDDQED